MFSAKSLILSPRFCAQIPVQKNQQKKNKKESSWDGAVARGQGGPIERDREREIKRDIHSVLAVYFFLEKKGKDVWSSAKEKKKKRLSIHLSSCCCSSG